MPSWVLQVIRGMKKIFFSLSLLISIMVPFMLSADTVPPFMASTGSFTRDLYMGMLSNSDVAHLQEFLRDRGLYDDLITGNFFILTKQALVKFQEKEGITPSSGYFGPKTRSRVNARIGGTVTLSREEQIALLQSQIKMLQAQLVNLIAQRQAAPSPIPTPILTTTPVPTPTTTPVSLPSPTPPASVATTTPPAPVAELRISGSTSKPFPDVATSPLKLGDIIISNTTDRAILFNQLELDLYDAMNSTANRNREVLFKLRDGTTTFDDLISKTDFTINNDPPRFGEETRRQVKVSFPRLIQAGQTYTSSLWVENLEYVINGSWRIQMLTAFINNSIAIQGGFTFTLTK